MHNSGAGDLQKESPTSGLVTTNALESMPQQIQATQRFISRTLTEKPDRIYRIDDYTAISNELYNNVKDAVTNRFPLSNDKYSLGVENVDYDDPDEQPVSKWKEAILAGKSMDRRLRGEWVLRDVEGNEVARTGRKTIMRVPMMNRENGSFVRNGSQYVFRNIMRLEPGVYCSSKPDGPTALFNVQAGSGTRFHMDMNPKTGVFTVRRGTGVGAPAYGILKEMGVTDEQMKQAWGEDLYKANFDAGQGGKARAAMEALYGR
jgi:DNA-directed RNA polymerase beta subunit